MKLFLALSTLLPLICKPALALADSWCFHELATVLENPALISPRDQALHSALQLKDKYRAFLEEDGLSLRRVNSLLGASVPGSSVTILTFDGVSYATTIGSRIARGGTKAFYALGNEFAVAYPSDDSTQWRRIVLEELSTNEFLKKLGLPTPPVIPALIKFKTGEVEAAFPTFLSPNFKNYPNKNAFVIDMKNMLPDFLPKGFQFLSAEKDFNNPQNWMGIIAPLLNDIRTIKRNHLSLNTDTANMVVVGKGHPWHSRSNLPFEVRVFLFDFARKEGPTTLAGLSRDNLPADFYKKHAEDLLERFLEHLFYWEQFGRNTVDWNLEDRTKWVNAILHESKPLLDQPTLP